MSSQYKIQILKNERHGYKRARLQISVGQAYHEGAKFYATAEWAARNFEQVSVNLCDTLQRHNLQYLGYSPFEAFDKSITMGDQWLERNREALELLPQLTLTRWESWKRSDRWPSAQAMTQKLYDNDNDFRLATEQTVELFWQRRFGKPGFEVERQIDFCHASRLYILEETAVSMIMSEPDIAEIYPGTFVKNLYLLRDKGLPSPKSMTSITFRKTGAAQKQFANAA